VSSRPVLVVDALNLFVRHFVANPTMNDSGEHVGGFVGFLKAISQLCERTFPKEVFVVWEGGGSPRRRSILKDYKDRRRPAKMNRYYGDELPDTLENRNKQISLIIEVLSNLPCNQIYIADCEADDIICRLVKYNKSGDRSVIVSSDRDLYQLLSKKIIQWSPGQKKYITVKSVLEKYDISAENFCTARAFAGDSSDKIKGVPGAGLKSMAKRFPELRSPTHISVNDVIQLAKERLETKNLKLYQNIIQHEQIAKRNWKLMYLDTVNLSAFHIEKLEFNIENFKPSANKMKVIKILRREGVSSFDVDSFFVALTSNDRKLNA
jgi:5'-3' exonuclease